MTRKRGRDSRTGRFISTDEAKRRPSTTTIETIQPPDPPKKPPKKPKGK